MNRIQHLLDGAGASRGNVSATAVEAGRYSAPADRTSPAILGPLHYEPNYPYPLIVWLHGPQGDPRQLRKIMPLVSLRNYVSVAPCGTVHNGSSSGRSGYDWCQTESHIDAAEQRVLSAIADVKCQYHVSPARIFIAGFDTGGTMALRLACHHPDVFAGAISLCGEFPLGHNPLCRLAEVRRLPLLLATGRDSSQYPPERVCENLRLLYSAGMAVSLRQYPCGHELTTNMLSDSDRWIMEQITAPSTVSADK